MITAPGCNGLHVWSLLLPSTRCQSPSKQCGGHWFQLGCLRVVHWCWRRRQLPNNQRLVPRAIYQLSRCVQVPIHPNNKLRVIFERLKLLQAVRPIKCGLHRRQPCSATASYKGASMSACRAKRKGAPHHLDRTLQQQQQHDVDRCAQPH